EQVAADPQEAKLLARLNARDAAIARAAAADARAQLEDAVKQKLTSPGLLTTEARRNAAAKVLAQDIVDLRAAGGAPSDLVKRNPSRWNDSLVKTCQESGICGPKFQARKAEFAQANLSPTAQRILAEERIANADAKAAAEAQSVAKLVPAPVGDVVDSLKADRSRLASEADRLAGQVAGNTLLKDVEADTRRALASVDQRIAALSEDKSLLSDAHPITKADEKLVDQGTSAVMSFLEHTSSEKLGELGLHDVSTAKVTSGEERLSKYVEAKAQVSKMDPASVAKLETAVRDSAAKGTSDLAKALAKEAPADEKVLAKAIEHADGLAKASGNPDAAATRAVFRDAKIKPADQALSDALGATKASAKSSFERHAEVAAAAKKADADTKAVLAKAAAADAKKEGRNLASIATESLKAKTEHDLSELKGLTKEQRAELAKSLDAVAKFDENETGAKAALEHMKALSSNPDMFETYRMASVNAAEELPKQKSWDKAWENGVKKMLEQSDYKPDEIMKVVDRDSGLKFYQQTARCLKL
ncbi:MAG: hypothetical protein ACXVCK_16065, partial [Bdellovibrionota bacterium]